MNIVKTFSLALLPLLLITGCGDVVKRDNNESGSVGIINLPGDVDDNETLPKGDVNATFDFKNYFPTVAKTISCQFSAIGINLNPTITYSGPEHNISVESDYDGLDLFEYTQMIDYMAMDTQIQDRRTFTWFDDKFAHLKRENKETNLVLRYFEDNDSIILSTTFKSVSSFTVSSGSTQATYTNAYENDSLYCKAKAIGDYKISSTLYADALEINCSANHSKGGTLSNSVVTVYNDDYNSSTIFLPQIGIVNVNYVSRDMNFSVECQP